MSAWLASELANSLSQWEREGAAEGGGRVRAVRLYANQPIGTVPRARQLRREAPEPERRLLRALREALPAYKWRHQAPVGPFYADILCFAEALVIEVDGDTHADRTARDASRTVIIAAEGFRVIRFTNDDVMHNLDDVLLSVAATLADGKGGVVNMAALTLPPLRGSLPLPQGEGMKEYRP